MAEELNQPFDKYYRDDVINAPPLPVASLKHEPSFYPQQSQLTPESAQEYYERTGRMPPGYESSPLIPIVHGQSNDELAEKIASNKEKANAIEVEAQTSKIKPPLDEEIVEESQQIPEQEQYQPYEPQVLEQPPESTPAYASSPPKQTATAIIPQRIISPSRSISSIISQAVRSLVRPAAITKLRGWHIMGVLKKERDMPTRFPPQFPVERGYSLFDFQYATRNDALGRDPRDQYEYPYLLSDAQGNSMRGLVRQMNVGHQFGNRILFPMGIFRGNRQKKDVGPAEKIQYVDEPPPIIMTELPKAPFQPQELQFFRPIEIPVITAQTPSPQPTSRKITGFQTGNKLVFPMGLVRTTTEMTRLRRFPPEFGAIGRGIPFRIRKAKK